MADAGLALPSLAFERVARHAKRESRDRIPGRQKVEL
jgi:hypothetical protein